ncbi:MAG: hypothetical protein Q8Q09_27475 [Deltaproteobacteria bacterium]|nr:hypothetical protein [Deltaproteobacteria bacterium]
MSLMDLFAIATGALGTTAVGYLVAARQSQRALDREQILQANLQIQLRSLQTDLMHAERQHSVLSMRMGLSGTSPVSADAILSELASGQQLDAVCLADAEGLPWGCAGDRELALELAALAPWMLAPGALEASSRLRVLGASGATLFALRCVYQGRVMILAGVHAVRTIDSFAFERAALLLERGQRASVEPAPVLPQSVTLSLSQDPALDARMRTVAARALWVGTRACGDPGDVAGMQTRCGWLAEILERAARTGLSSPVAIVLQREHDTLVQFGEGAGFQGGALLPQRQISRAELHRIEAVLRRLHHETRSGERAAA